MPDTLLIAPHYRNATSGAAWQVNTVQWLTEGRRPDQT
jgi:hypothetical protein